MRDISREIEAVVAFSARRVVVGAIIFVDVLIRKKSMNMSTLSETLMVLLIPKKHNRTYRTVGGMHERMVAIWRTTPSAASSPL